jgi:hypothetical protein
LLPVAGGDRGVAGVETAVAPENSPPAATADTGWSLPTGETNGLAPAKDVGSSRTASAPLAASALPRSTTEADARPHPRARRARPRSP